MIREFNDYIQNGRIALKEAKYISKSAKIDAIPANMFCWSGYINRVSSVPYLGLLDKYLGAFAKAKRGSFDLFIIWFVLTEWRKPTSATGDPRLALADSLQTKTKFCSDLEHKAQSRETESPARAFIFLQNTEWREHYERNETARDNVLSHPERLLQEQLSGEHM